MNCRNPHLKASVLLLFIAFMTIGIFQLSLQYDPEWSIFQREHQSDFILSESNPTFSREYDAMRITNIEIASITTNSTPISLIISNETHTKLSVENITRLRGLSMDVKPIPPETINVTVSWKNQTASVRLEILIHELVPPPTARPIVLPTIPIVAICGAVVLGYNLIRFRQDCWNPVLMQKEAPSVQDQIVPLSLIVLALVSGAMASPFVRDITTNRYQMIERETVLDQRMVTGALTEANPMKDYSFYSIADSYNTSIRRLRIHSFEFDDAPIFIQGEFEDESIYFVLESATNSSSVWLEPDFEYQPSNLRLERIDRDVQYSFVIDIIGIEMNPKNNPTVPSILAVCGLFVLGVTIYRAWQIQKIVEESGIVAEY